MIVTFIVRNLFANVTTIMGQGFNILYPPFYLSIAVFPVFCKMFCCG